MRIVVTGGTGFIGREVVKRLLDAPGDEVVVVTRDPERAEAFGGRVRLVQAFAGDAISLGKVFTGADVVVHAIQFPNHPVEQPGKGRSYLEVDGRGTEVAAAMAKRVGVRRFVYLSGAGAGQGRPQSWFRAKDMAEAAIREANALADYFRAYAAYELSIAKALIPGSKPAFTSPANTQQP